MLSRIAALLLLLLLPLLQAQGQKPEPLRLAQTIPLPGVEGRIDHLAVDVARQRLFVAALGNNTVEVIDLKAGKRLRSLSGLHEPQGIACVPAANRCYVANGQSGTCEIFQTDTLQHLGTILLGDDADNVRFDAKANRIYVGYGSGALGVADATTGQKQGSLSLSGHPESFQMEQAGSRLFINIPSAEQIAVVDRLKKQVIAAWPLDGARSNFPMALDEANHRLFVGCRNPSRVLVYDTGTGKVTTTLSIAGDTDDLFYDAARKRLYVSCGAGQIDIFRQADTDHYTPIGTIPTAAGARTSLFVPELGRLYLAVPHRGKQAAEIRVFAVE